MTLSPPEYDHPVPTPDAFTTISAPPLPPPSCLVPLTHNDPRLTAISYKNVDKPLRLASNSSWFFLSIDQPGVVVDILVTPNSKYQRNGKETQYGSTLGYTDPHRPTLTHTGVDSIPTSNRKTIC